MSTKRFVLPSYPDRLLQKLADTFRQHAEELQADAFVGDGLLIEGLVFTAGQTRSIAHGLGRRIRGWLEITPADETTRVALVPSHDSATDLSIQVRVTATSAGRVNLRVY